mmetsp:Transcript_5012/g.7866  ORF Transcript_5012/g.7866 Transcript_5012/m.7866 type:complete len:104 (+) Transcript_5012:80-391(+)
MRHLPFSFKFSRMKCFTIDLASNFGKIQCLFHIKSIADKATCAFFSTSLFGNHVVIRANLKKSSNQKASYGWSRIRALSIYIEETQKFQLHFPSGTPSLQNLM